jgi:cysteinyl-tRNA synthetase
MPMELSVMVIILGLRKDRDYGTIDVKKKAERDPQPMLTSGGVWSIMENMIQFFNTLSGTTEPFRPINEGEVLLYTCGPTVYDFAHIGNFRAYMFEDLLKRFLLFKGFKVRHVMNITDVEDKIIRAAAAQGVSLQQYTEPYTAAFFEDLERLRILPADVYPRATEHIPEMVKMVQALIDKGYAYQKEGSYYFEISRFPNYGRLSKLNLEERKVGVRVDADEYEKESVHDFALWKAPKEGEFRWETALGPGRPGWHIECSVMSSKYLGDSFDIHCGGVDNIFPHHENEIAQSEACTGKTFVNYWLHCQHLIRDGEKMSKSKGNTIAIRDLTEQRGTDPAALRLLLLSTHYRKMLNFTFEALHQAESSLQRIRDFLTTLETEPLTPGESPAAAALVSEAVKKFDAGLSDDLNISQSLSAVFGLIKEGNILLSREEVSQESARLMTETIRAWDAVLGILPPISEEILPEEIQRRIESRQEARAAKDYARADRIRDELLSLGIVLEDTRDGVRWKRTAVRSPKE